MKVYGGADLKTHTSLTSTLAACISFTTRPLYSHGNSRRCPLDRMLSGPQSRPGRQGEEKILDPTGTRNPTHGSSSP
jgi:hypothetical protein